MWRLEGRDKKYETTVDWFNLKRLIVWSHPPWTAYIVSPYSVSTQLMLRMSSLRPPHNFNRRSSSPSRRQCPTTRLTSRSSCDWQTTKLHSHWEVRNRFTFRTRDSCDITGDRSENCKSPPTFGTCPSVGYFFTHSGSPWMYWESSLWTMRAWSWDFSSVTQQEKRM